MATGSSEGASTAIPLMQDTLTFEALQAVRFKEIEKKIEEELKRKQKDWEKEVEKMKQEFLLLYPSDKEWGSDELLNDPMVSKRRGSTDVLDRKKMKTLYLDYPDTCRKFKLRFDVTGFDPKSIKVNTDGDRIIIKALRMENNGKGEQIEREYNRKIEKPREVDFSKLKSFLTSDGILIVEAPLPPHTLNLRKLSHSPSRSSQGSSGVSRSPSSSPRTPSAQKYGVPTFHETNGKRFMSLLIDMGPLFKAKDITVQIIKHNRIQIKAKHEERTSERLSKSKFHKEYELPEKIETYSVRGGLMDDGKLIVGALCKGQMDGMTKKEAGEQVSQEVNSKAVPCNVLDLAFFPPTNQVIAT